MTSGKSKTTAKTRVLAKNDLDRFLALHVTATTDMYLQQLASEVRRGQAAEEQVKDLELKLMEADAALNRAAVSLNERDHAVARCNLRITDLVGEIDDKDNKLTRLRGVVESIQLKLVLLQTKKLISTFGGCGQYALLGEIRLKLMNGSVPRSFLNKWIDRFDEVVEKNNEANELFDTELRDFIEFIDKINCT